MNGSSGFRGLPMTRSGTGGSSSSTNHNVNASAGGAGDSRPPWLTSATSTEMLALRAAFYPRLADSLASQLYSQFPNAAVAAHLTGLQQAAAAAANSAVAAAASNTPQTMPPPLSPYHPNAAGGPHPGSTAAAAHHPLLSPYFYSAAYGAGNTTAPFGATPGRPPYLPVDSAFLPTGSALPRYRYLLPTAPQNDSAAAAAAAVARIRNTFAAAAAANTTLERTMSESADTMSRFLSRRPFSPLPPSSASMSANVGQSASNVVQSTVADSVAAAAAFYHQQQQQSLATNSTTNDGGANSISRTTGGSSSSGQHQQQQTSADGRRRLMSASLPTQPYYPSHFMKGTVIQLANGDLKRVEDLNTEDFVRSAHLTNDLKIDSSTVVKIDEKSPEIVLLSFAVGEQKVHVSVEATVEHPFFVIGQGWSSCNPERTQNLYGLPCQRLQVGDICISLTHRDVVGTGKNQQQQQTTAAAKGCCDSNLYGGGGNVLRPQATTKVGFDVPFPMARSTSSTIQQTTTNVTGGVRSATTNVVKRCATMDDVATVGAGGSSIMKRPKLNTVTSKLSVSNRKFVAKQPHQRSLTPPADWTKPQQQRRRRRPSLP